MSEIERLERALRNAAAAGDTAAATQFARAIRELPAQQPKSPSLRDSPIAQAISQRSLEPLRQATRTGVLGSRETGLAYGAAKPFIGLAQLGMSAAERAFGTPEDSQPMSQRVAGGLQQFEAARDEAGGSSIPVIAGQMLPFSAAARTISAAPTILGRVGQGLVGGGIAGAVEPVTNPDVGFGAAKTAQVATGAAVGPATTLLGGLGTAISRRFNNRFLDGANLEAGGIANVLVGDRRPQVLAALGGPTRPAPITPFPPNDRFVPLSQRSVLPATQQVGSLTAAQAAAPARSAEFSALGQRAEVGRPSEFMDVAAAQNQARAQDIARIAGTPEEMAAAQLARRSATEPLYQAAEASDLPVDALKTVRLVDKLIAKRQGRPQVTSVLNNVRETMFESYPYQQRARDSWNAVRASISSYRGAAPQELQAARKTLNAVKNFDIDPFTAIVRLRALRPQDQAAREQIQAAITNLEIPDAVVTQNAQQLINASRNIGDLLDARDLTGKKINTAVSKELTVLRRSVDQQIARAVPEFGEAQRLFSDLSRPIDRMNIGRYLQDRLIPALNDAGASLPNRASVFATAMRDLSENVAPATGFKRGGGLIDMMTPDEMATIQRIGSGLARDADVQMLGRAGQGKVTQKIGNIFSDQLPNALNRKVMIINAILRRTGVGATERTMNALSIKMQDPAAMADIMEKATAAERRAIERAFIMYVTTGAASTPDDALAWANKAATNVGSTVTNIGSAFTSDTGNN